MLVHSAHEWSESQRYDHASHQSGPGLETRIHRSGSAKVLLARRLREIANIAHAGGEVVTLDSFAPDGSLDLADLTATIEAADVRTLLVNFPANPTGDVLSDDELAALAELAREQDLILVSDEVDNWIRYDDTPRTLFARAALRLLRSESRKSRSRLRTHIFEI